MKPEDFPEVLQTVLDRAGLGSYLGDLGAFAEGLTVIVKGGRSDYARQTGLDLVRAGAALVAGDVVGLQIAYDYQGERWRDTVLSVPGGFRLVRVRS